MQQFKPRIFLIRHGQSARHSGKIFLGQADIPLSDKGKKEAKAAGKELKRLEARADCIYSSDLARAKETADIIALRLCVPVVPDMLFREMAMGSWDGELIEDIKAKFPEEYARRGEDLRNYRIPGGENFYDLKGRVTREFHRILTGTKERTKGDGSLSEDIIIVAHLGVLDALADEILGPGHKYEGYRFPTGSVNVFDVPDWLLPENETP